MDEMNEELPVQINDEMLELFNQMDTLLELEQPATMAFADNSNAHILPPMENFPDWDEYLSLLAADNAFLSSVDMKSNMHKEIFNLRKHRRGDSSPVGMQSGDADDEQIKSQRLGSLGRIIANTALVVERTESGSRLPPKIDLVALTKLRQDVLDSFFQAFNLGDMIGLAKLVQEQCSETCELVTPDLTEAIQGRPAIMMLFSLTFENFPDGIYRELPAPQQQQQSHLDPYASNINVVSRRYAFSGTRVFDQPINLLYSQVVQHWTTVQESGELGDGNIIDKMAYSWIPESGREAAASAAAAAAAVSSAAQGVKAESTSSTMALQPPTACVVGDHDASDKIVLTRSSALPIAEISPGVSPATSFSFQFPSQPPTPSNQPFKSIAPQSLASGRNTPSSSSSFSLSTSNLSLFKTSSASSMKKEKHGNSPAWIKKFAKSLSTSFGSVANKIASSLTLKERQTKYKRIMHFEFDIGSENMITKISILSIP